MRFTSWLRAIRASAICYFAVGFWMLNGQARAVQYPYTVTRLVPGASESLPRGINNSGLVVGYNFSGGQSAFLYNAGQVTTLSAFVGSGMNSAYSGTSGINNNGQVVGWVNGQAIRYDNGVTTPLGTLPGFPYNYGAAINDSGQIVGTATPVISDESQGHAFLYNGGQITDLNALPGYNYSYARDINSSGRITGSSSLADGLHSHPFMYNSGVLTDLNTLGGVYGAAAAINDGGDIVGESMSLGSDWGSVHAFVYNNTGMHDIGTLPGTTISSATDINAAGQIIGTTAIAVGQPYYHAFIYSNGQMTDLNALIDPASHWTIQFATAINDNGWIVGVGTNTSTGFARQAILLTPTPEPGSMAVLATAAVALRRGKRN